MEHIIGSGTIPLIGGSGIEKGGAGIKTSNIIGYAVGMKPAEGEVFPAILTDDEGQYLVLDTSEHAQECARILLMLGADVLAATDPDELIVFPVGIVAAEHLMSKSVVVRKPPKN